MQAMTTRRVLRVGDLFRIGHRSLRVESIQNTHAGILINGNHAMNKAIPLDHKYRVGQIVLTKCGNISRIDGVYTRSLDPYEFTYDLETNPSTATFYEEDILCLWCE